MKIMVTLDGSEFSEAVIPAVAPLARLAQAEVHLVQVVRSSSIRGEVEGEVADRELTARAYYASTGLAERYDPATDQGLAAPSYPQALEEEVARTRTRLAALAAEFAPLRPRVAVLTGDDIDQTLADYARDGQFDLVAMSSHGRTGLARLVMGSHAEAMLRSGAAPALIVRPKNL